MTKGSQGSGKSALKAVATTGYASSVNTTASYNQSSGRDSRSYETKNHYSYGDKQTGSYGKATVTEKASAGDFHWKNGTTGTRNEYKQTSTVRVGDKSGYTEVYNEQRVRNVTYDRSNCSSKNYITYDNDDGDSYGGGGNNHYAYALGAYTYDSD